MKLHFIPCFISRITIIMAKSRGLKVSPKIFGVFCDTSKHFLEMGNSLGLNEWWSHDHGYCPSRVGREFGILFFQCGKLS